jgi:hypothetical protein
MNMTNVRRTLTSVILFFSALSVTQTAKAYDYTIENFSGAPIVWAHAQTVSSLCHDVTLDIPNGALLPGQSMSFSTSSICLVDQLLISYRGPWDGSALVLQVRQTSTPNPADVAACNACNQNTPCRMALNADGFMERVCPCPNQPVCQRVEAAQSAVTVTSSPAMTPPSWNSAIGLASGTYVVGPDRICYSSGLTDFFTKTVKGALAKVGQELFNAARPALPPNTLGSCNTTIADCWANAAASIYNLAIDRITPVEISTFLSIQATAWGFYSNYGFSKLMIPQERTAIDKLSQALPASLHWQDIDPNLLRNYQQNLKENVGCGW